MGSLCKTLEAFTPRTKVIIKGVFWYEDTFPHQILHRRKHTVMIKYLKSRNDMVVKQKLFVRPSDNTRIYPLIEGISVS